jgi:hypothetical protein
MLNHYNRAYPSHLRVAPRRPRRCQKPPTPSILPPLSPEEAVSRRMATAGGLLLPQIQTSTETMPPNITQDLEQPDPIGPYHAFGSVGSSLSYVCAIFYDAIFMISIWQ